MIKKELTKDEKVKKEIARLNKIFKNLDDNKKSIAESLIERSAYIRVTLEQLEKDIDESGVTDEMPQGEYSIIRESPYVKTYNTMIQRYTTINKEIAALLPKEVEVKEISDGFDEFVMGR